MSLFMKCLIYTILVFSFPLYAADQFDQLYTFTEDIRDVVLESPGGHPMPNREFELTTAQAFFA